MKSHKPENHELPPGELVNLNQKEWSDRNYILKQSSSYGPIFKALTWDELWICIVGLPECQRFIQEHSKHLTPQTLRLQPLFPKGFLRQMDGKTHHAYRRALVRAIHPTVMTNNRVLHEQTVADGLSHYYSIQDAAKNKREAFIKSLNNIASGLLIQIIFGARYGSETFKILMHHYNDLGPNGLVWQIGDQQRNAFTEIRKCLLKQISEPSANEDQWIPESIIERMHKEGEIDDTMLGNLIYMVEMGRYDMYSLFRWLAKFGAEHPTILEQIASEDEDHLNGEILLGNAFVLETLRLEQSERLLRKVGKDLVFDGYLIPKDCMVRLCLWESHKLSSSFTDPFDFKPNRFVANKFTTDLYAPFGLGVHQCPMANVAIRMSALLLRVLAKNYVVDPVSDGPPIRGVYHWEPAYQFAVNLKEKSLA